MTQTTPELRKQVWEIGLYTGLILGFGAHAFLIGLSDFTFGPIPRSPVVFLAVGLVLISLGGVLEIHFRRSNRRGEQA